MDGGSTVSATDFDRALASLLADHERQGGRLSQAQVDRAAERRGLDGVSLLALCAALRARGVAVAEAPEVREAQGLGNQRKLRAALVALPGLRAALAHRLLPQAEEEGLGRRIALGRRVAVDVAAGSIRSDCPDAARALRLAHEARESLVVHNMRLVVSVARRYAHRGGLDLADLVQEGVFGLARAAEQYDHTLGFKFSTYAVWWIRQAVGRAADNQGPMIRLPIHRAEQVRKLQSTEAKFMLTTGRRPSIPELAAELDWPQDAVLRVRHAAGLKVLSLDAPKSADEPAAPGARSLASAIPAEAPSPEEILVERQLGRELRAAMASVPARTRTVLEMRSGFWPPGPMTLEEVGQRYGVSRERIRQIEAKGLKALGHPARGRRLRTFLGP
ncbi:hypothetical protein GCM10009416_34280 [Craurococcus roseus]|uniref:RNA polymerase sigma-70 domain-containing protein n=1 Tax=Craurococcus roseus TaxID=77585 RepID=A0ABN1FL55_9PROT